MIFNPPTQLNGIYYKVSGEGPVLLLLRGWGRSARFWLGFDEELAKYFKVVVLDYRGIGRTLRAIKWTDSMKEMADDIIEVLDHLQIPICHVFSLSLGGMIAMALIEHYPQRIGRMIIANSSIAYLGWRRISFRALFSLALCQCQGGDFVQKQADILLSRATDNLTRAKIVDEWKMILAVEPPRIRTHIIQLLAAARFRPSRNFTDFKDRIVIVHGENDLLVPNSNSKRIAARLGHTHSIAISAGGHELPLDSRAGLISLIQAELK